MTPPISVQEYLSSTYPDGDREYLDGVVVERNWGTPRHSSLQKFVTVHLANLEKQYQIVVFPECRTRIAETRYRVPDVLVMQRPFRQNDRVLLDPPLIIVEIVSPDDRLRDTIHRFRDYEALGVRHIVQMDPEDRTTFIFTHGDLVRRDLASLEIPGRGFCPSTPANSSAAWTKNSYYATDSLSRLATLEKLLAVRAAGACVAVSGTMNHSLPRG